MLDIHVPAQSAPVTITFPRGPAHMPDALERVCRAAVVPASAIRSGSRKGYLARPRQIFCWIAHRKLARSLSTIGKYIGRDHTTVLHGVRRVDRAIWDNDGRFIDIIAEAMKGDA